MLEILEPILSRQCLLNRQTPILVGVSGGPDSLCLMDVLVRMGYPIIVAHLNHGLRVEADAEALQAKQYARLLNAPFIYEKVDVATSARRDRMSIEEAARCERYRFLFSQAGKYGAQAVAVGHTADDQVETVLMHLIRGAGLAGLKGMAYRWHPTPWSSDIPLVRPLLGIWREQILEYVTSHGYQPVYDPSNLDTSLFRNKLRHELIPTLVSYNPNARQLIWQTADVLQEDYHLIEQLLADAWKECLREAGQGFLGLDIVTMREMSPGLQRHVIRWALATLHPDIRDLDYAALDRAVSFIKSSSVSRKIELFGGISLSLEGDTLWLAAQGAELSRDHWPQINVGEHYELNIPGELRLPCGWTLSAEQSSHPDWGILDNVDRYRAWVDLEAVRQPLIVRSRLPGERFTPLGMDGFSLKASDFMVNVKLPRRARSGWPLVCAIDQNTLKEEIIWIPGYRQSHYSRVTAGTAKLILLQMQRTPEL